MDKILYRRLLIDLFSTAAQHWPEARSARDIDRKYKVARGGLALVSSGERSGGKRSPRLARGEESKRRTKMTVLQEGTRERECEREKEGSHRTNIDETVER